MKYSDLLLESGRAGIERGTNQQATNAAWNYYSQYGGTGVETPALRMALMNIGKQKRQATDNLSAYYKVLSRQENLEEKWRRIWEQVEGQDNLRFTDTIIKGLEQQQAREMQDG